MKFHACFPNATFVRSFALLSGLACLSVSAPTSAQTIPPIGPVVVSNPISIPKLDDIPVWRTQLRVETCDVKNAGTDDSAYVTLRNGGEKYYLDYGGDDRERADVNYYDVVYSGVSTVKDIQQLTIGKTGSDGWCVKNVQLLINNSTSPVFTYTWSSGLWLDNDNGHSRTTTFSSSQLRNQSSWNLAGGRISIAIPPTRIPGSVLESMVESVMGNEITGSGLYWGFRHDRYVEAWHESSDDRQTAHIDLDLGYSADYWADPSVDVDFDLEFDCVNNRLKIDASHIAVDVDGNDLLDWLTLGVQAIVVEIVESKINGKLENISLLNTSTPVCPHIYVEDDGSVKMSLL